MLQAYSRYDALHLDLKIVVATALLSFIFCSSCASQILTWIDPVTCQALPDIYIDRERGLAYMAVIDPESAPSDAELSLVDLRTGEIIERNVLQTGRGVIDIAVIPASNGGGLFLYRAQGPFRYSILDSNLRVIESRRMDVATSMQVFRAPDGNPVLATSMRIEASNTSDAPFGFRTVCSIGDYRFYSFETSSLSAYMGVPRAYFMPDDSTVLALGLEFTKDDAAQVPRNYDTDRLMITEISSLRNEQIRKKVIDIGTQRVMEVPGFTAGNEIRLVREDGGRLLLLLSALNHDEIKILRLNEDWELVDLPKVSIKSDCGANSIDNSSLEIVSSWFAWNQWNEATHSYPLHHYTVYLGADELLLCIRRLDCQ